LKPIDILVCNGDLIDGRGERSAGTELIISDRNKQIMAAVECIQQTDAPHVVITRGTPYHVGGDIDFEDIIAQAVNADKIGDHEWIDVNGVVFDVKHKPAGTSQVPHTRNTGISRDRLWNLIWSEFDEQPKSDIIIRSHAHHFTFCGEENWLAMITPALQGVGSKFGAQQCVGTVHWGLIHFDVYDTGEYFWKPHIFRVEEQQVKPIKL
jgi:hypothetical protein